MWPSQLWYKMPQASAASKPGSWIQLSLGASAQVTMCVRACVVLVGRGFATGGGVVVGV